MKTPTLKMPAYLSIRGVMTATNTSFQKMKAPLYTSFWGAVSVTNYSLQRIKTPLYLSLLGVVVVSNTSFKKKINMPDARSATRYTYSVLIIKSKYELKVFDSSGEWLVTYPVVFGNKDLGDKMMEGDRRTPEGIFHIAGKRKHEKWNRFMMIDYPTQESYQKFNQRKAKGVIPQGARIGGSIGIHGTWPHEDYAIDQYQNWTEGCVSTKNMYIEEIFSLLPVGTKVEIRH